MISSKFRVQREGQLQRTGGWRLAAGGPLLIGHTSVTVRTASTSHVLRRSQRGAQRRSTLCWPQTAIGRAIMTMLYCTLGSLVRVTQSREAYDHRAFCRPGRRPPPTHWDSPFLGSGRDNLLNRSWGLLKGHKTHC